MANDTSILQRILRTEQPAILAEWLPTLKGGHGQTGRLREGELASQAGEVLRHLGEAAAGGDFAGMTGEAFEALRHTLSEVSRARALQSFSPSETATFVLSLKQPLMARLFAAIDDRAQLEHELQVLAKLIDELALHTTDAFQKSREEVIVRQQHELAELSTPVVRLWKGILALPLIGTLDSERTQVVMENLLRSLVDTGAEIAIIDITGVPTVDTQVAQHLLKTISAARLMGADCVVSGIRPQIAQTMVHLGVELNVISKATLADAFAIALERMGKAVVSVKPKA